MYKNINLKKLLIQFSKSTIYKAQNSTTTKNKTFSHYLKSLAQCEQIFLIFLFHLYLQHYLQLNDLHTYY